MCPKITLNNEYFLYNLFILKRAQNTMNIAVSTLLQVHGLPWEDKWGHSAIQIEGTIIYTWKPIKLGDIFIPWLSNDALLSENYSPIFTKKLS